VIRDDLLARLGGLPQRVAVLRALMLGDLVCATPALRALRHALPAAEITLIGLPWARGFARRFAHLVDAFTEFPGYPGMPEREPDIEAFAGFVQSMRSRRFDLVLQMHGSGETSNEIARALGGRVTAGFHPAGGECPDPQAFVSWPARGAEVQRLLALIDFLGVPRRGDHVEFPVRDDERRDAEALMRASGLARGEFAIVHPGARLASRRWPVERFACIARLLADSGWRVAVTGSGPEEAAICAALCEQACGDVVDLHDRTTLGTLAGLVAAARLVVCNDTGISHVAAGCGTPSVVVSCGADPTRFAPAHRRHRVLFRMTECRPCLHDDCPVGHPCATQLTVDAVAQASFAQLRDFAPAHRVIAEA
jgi:ADP-heptose:LPS heptosyltransferase